MLRLRFLLSSFLLALTSIAEAQERLSLLQQTASPHSLALGGVSPALISSDPAVVFSSPALLGQEQHGQLALSYQRLAAIAHLGNAAYGQQWGERGAWSIGLRFLSYGKIQGYDRWGQATGSFTASEALLQASYSYELTDRLRAGISFLGIYAAIEGYQRWGIATDLGLNYYNPERDLSLGLALVHAGRTFAYEYQAGGSLSWDIQLGWSQRLTQAPFTLHLSLYDLHPKRTEELPTPRTVAAQALRHLALGLEFAPSERFWIALGYRPKVAQDVHLLHGYRWAGLSGGVGFTASRCHISVGFSTTDPGHWNPLLSFRTQLSSFH